MGDIERYMASVRLGPKGQIVIPRQVRAMFGISPGDMLMLLADVRSGIAIRPAESFIKIAEMMLGVSTNELNSGEPADQIQTIAREIKKAADAPQESEPE